MERKLKNLAAFLIVTFMTTMIPTSVMAAEEPSFTGSEQSNIKKASIVGELKEKREENVKYFLLDDGTYQAVEYKEPVHYMADGKWEDIDNTLVETTGDENIDNTGEQSQELIQGTEGTSDPGSEEIIQGTEGATEPGSEEVVQGTEGTPNPDTEEVVGSEESGEYYQNTKNEISIKIAKNINSNKLVSVKKDNYEVSWNMKMPGNSQGEIKEKDIAGELDKFFEKDTSSSKETSKENMKKMIAGQNESQVNFTGISDGVDLQYLLQGKTLKENIVINKAISENSFTFNLSLKNLIPEVKDNTVKFLDKDTKKDVFYIVPPLMYDAAGETSTNIKIDIKSDKNGYILTLSPDKEWINNSSRKFPIVLDPDITTSLVQSDIVETFICSNDPSSKADNMFVRVGDVTSIGTTETYIRFNNLPALKTGDMVTSSQLYLYKESAYSGADGEIEAHRILSDWSTSTINWSNKPSVESSITDTQKVSQDWYSWDITNMTKDWYNNGNNYGLKLNRTDPASGNTTFLSSDTSSAYSGGWPQVVVSYINNSGLEGYWTYHSQSAGRAGTGYVNDYNGNLIFTHDDIDSSGSRMPISVKHVYNSNDRESSFGYGLGWRTNLNQRVLSQVIDGTQYYVYIDEDGTKHYFYYDSTSSSYKNEEGLELTLKVNSDSSYDIIDKSGTDLYFVPGGYLHKIIDKNNNTAYVWYNGATLSRVVDGAGRTTLFESTPEGYLLSITDPAGRKTEYRYNGIELSTIIYPDGNRTIYYYDANHNMTDAINYDGMRLDFDYYTASPYRTQKVKLIGSDGASGGELNFDYGFNETSFTDVKGRKETYQFNNSGNTICVTDPNGNAEAYKYLSNSNGKSNNKLDVESKLQKNSRNYLKNHSAETADSNWDFGYWGASPLGSGSFSSEASFIGSKSLKVSKTDYFDRNFYSQTLNLTKGKTYTLSGYIKTIDVTSDKNKGAGLFVNYQDSSGNWQTVDGNYVTGTNDWERYSVTFTLPSDASSTTVFARAGISEDKGTAYFDALQLEEGNIENRYNLLENSDFDYGSPTSEKWTYNTCDSKGIVTTLENRSAFRFDGDLGKSKNISQEVNVSGNAGDSFVISGWAKADALPENTGTYRYFALDLGFHLADGTYQWEVVKFNSDTGNWQFTSGRAVAKQNYTSVTMYALYYDEENYAWFDNLQLYKEEFGQSYQYDSKGNVVSTADLAKQQSSFEYNGNNDLVTATDPKGGKFSYTYYDNRNIKTATSAENVVYSFEYDAYGNPKKTTIGGAPFISSSATYTADGNYTSTVTDASGNTVSYDYDLNKGTLKTSTDAKGKVTTNGYDSNDRLTSVTKNVDGADITNSYAYVNDRLDTITHNGFNYKFKYDSIGRNTGVDVGTQNLITNTYEPNGGNLLESTYGNGDKVGNDFDSLDRVISKKVNGTEIAHYTYDSNGGLGILEDKVNNVTYKYTYDLADRLTKVTDSKGNIFKNSYDTNNNISKQTRIIGGNAFETGYEFDKDNKIKKVTLNSTAKYVGYNYDSLARLQDRTINFGNSGTYITSFSYLPGANGSATTKVGSINNNGSILNYTYDSNGNIETISQGTNRIQKYYYNELSELIREDNKVLNKTIKYTYDAGGNIVSKTEYAYTEAADPGTPTSTINYQYGDSNWKDKLTSYNGKAISYDEIGNPLTYDGYTYSWDRGRTLTGITGNEKNISYKYNDSGIRTEKNVNGTVSKYILNGDKVAYEEVTDGINTDKLHYNYDSNGDVVSLSYNDYRNIVGGSSAIGSFETPDSIGGVSLVDVTIPQTSTNKRAIRLNAGASIPAIAS
ncbi:MAG: DNRLRE domain-containing protein, partial [Clostridiaceae bacterium]